MMRLVLVVAVISLLLPASVGAQEKSDVAKFAGQALADYLENVVTPRNVGALGFESVGEAKLGQLGEPLEVGMVGLRDLKEYSAGAALGSVVKDAEAYWFPVTVDNETRAQLEILKIGGELVAGEFGSSKTAGAVAEATRMLPQVAKEGDEVSLLKVPVLAAAFLRVEGPEGEFLLPAMVDPERLGIEAGKAYPAEELLAKMHEIALQIDENKLQ